MKSTAFTIPMRTKSGNGGHGREHHFARARRVKAERTAVALWFPRRVGVTVPAVVYLVRCSPGTLDAEDNLTAALKSVRDEIARLLGVDDRDPRVDWVYGQQRGRAAVMVKIEFGADVHVKATCADKACLAHWRAA